MSNTTPAYLVLVSQLLELCDDAQVVPARDATTSTLPENTGYVFLRFGDKSSAALIIPKNYTSGKLCDIHIDTSDVDGWVPLKRPNGRVIGHIDAATADLKEIVSRLVGSSKRPLKRASKAASQAPVGDLSELLAKLAQLGKGIAKAPASPAPLEPEMPEDMEEYVDSL